MDSYLDKDVLSLAEFHKPELLNPLVKALAFQVGNEVSYSEIAQLIGADKETVIRYVDILEKGFVIFKLSSFSSNLRNEIKSKDKIYFYDNGLRNTVKGDFSSLANRRDVGALWENFLVSERKKQISYSRRFVQSYFWRKRQQEIAYVEQEASEIRAYDFKWNPKKIKNIPKSFTDKYGVTGTTIHRENFREFVNID